jgi:deoxyribonuclease V
VAGLDAAFSLDGKYCLAAAVLWDLHSRDVVESRLVQRRVTFPYRTGLLSFREAPALLAALRKLQQPPDVLLCDGQGIAHPRRLGIACHIGLFYRLPSIGCAKSRLIGTFSEPGPLRDSRSPLLVAGIPVGYVLRTRSHVRPVYVSPGHLTDLETACAMVLRCTSHYRIPEPTRLADQMVHAARVTGVGLR